MLKFLFFHEIIDVSSLHNVEKLGKYENVNALKYEEQNEHMKIRNYYGTRRLNF